jgi:hypothetical protein
MDPGTGGRVQDRREENAIESVSGGGGIGIDGCGDAAFESQIRRKRLRRSGLR